MKQFFSLPLFILFLANPGEASDQATIRSILDGQIQCWNKGDLECFMSAYWKSDQLMFIGSRGLKYGWQTTLDNYKRSYPDKQAMGELSFVIARLEEISADAYYCVGKWQLKREDGNLEGHFTLLWRKIEGRWVIVADHSS